MSSYCIEYCALLDFEIRISKLIQYWKQTFQALPDLCTVDSKILAILPALKLVQEWVRSFAKSARRPFGTEKCSVKEVSFYFSPKQWYDLLSYIKTAAVFIEQVESKLPLFATESRNSLQKVVETFASFDIISFAWAQINQLPFEGIFLLSEFWPVRLDLLELSEYV
jgi:hypothetical protein